MDAKRIKIWGGCLPNAYNDIWLSIGERVVVRRRLWFGHDIQNGYVLWKSERFGEKGNFDAVVSLGVVRRNSGFEGSTETCCFELDFWK